MKVFYLFYCSRRNMSTSSSGVGLFTGPDSKENQSANSSPTNAARFTDRPELPSGLVFAIAAPHALPVSGLQPHAQGRAEPGFQGTNARRTLAACLQSTAPFPCRCDGLCGTEGSTFAYVFSDTDSQRPIALIKIRSWPKGGGVRSSGRSSRSRTYHRL